VASMRPTLSVRKRPLAVPELGQRVRLRTARGRWRGSYRAVSEPYTDEGGAVVVRVAEEEEYQAARREGRRAIGMPWPVGQLAVILPPSGSEEETGELPTLPQHFEKPPQSADVLSLRPRPTSGGALESPQSGRRRGRLWRRVFRG
jgi:hypothetical protein